MKKQIVYDIKVTSERGYDRQFRFLKWPTRGDFVLAISVEIEEYRESMDSGDNDQEDDEYAGHQIDVLEQLSEVVAHADWPAKCEIGTHYVAVAGTPIGEISVTEHEAFTK